MRNALLLLLIVVTGLSVSLHAADAASKKDFISKSERDALYTSFPALKQAEEEMQRVYRETRAIIGEEGGGGAWLGEGQVGWENVTDRIALSKNDPGSPELVAALIDFSHQRIAQLQAIAAEGRVIERQIYKSTAGIERHLELWRYENNKVKAEIVSFPDTAENQCVVRSTLTQGADDTWQLVIPDLRDAAITVANTADGYTATLKKDGIIACTFSRETPLSSDEALPPSPAALPAMGLTISTDADAFTANVVVTGADDDRPKGIATFAGPLRRSDKPTHADDPTLEEVASCTLGTDRSQEIRLLRNDGISDSFVYYLKTSQGLIPLSSFAQPSLRGTFDEVEQSRGMAVSVACNDDGKESVLIVTGQFWSNYLHIHVIRYNSARKEWQVLQTAERLGPILVYLGTSDMKVVVSNAHASASTPQFIVYTVTGRDTKRSERNKPPASAEYRVLQGLP